MVRRLYDISQVNNAWGAMWRGMRAYGVAITVIWALSATSVLAVFAVAVTTWWLHVVLGVGAVLELAFSAFTLAFLIRASNAGRFDTERCHIVRRVSVAFRPSPGTSGGTPTAMWHRCRDCREKRPKPSSKVALLRKRGRG